MFQGGIADALTHTGQLALLRRLSGHKMKGENYSRADIVEGRVGAEQTPPKAGERVRLKRGRAEAAALQRGSSTFSPFAPPSTSTRHLRAEGGCQPPSVPAIRTRSVWPCVSATRCVRRNGAPGAPSPASS